MSPSTLEWPAIQKHSARASGWSDQTKTLACGPLFDDDAEVVELSDGGFDVAADLGPVFGVGQRRLGYGNDAAIAPARAASEGAVRTAARYPAAARRHGRDSQSGHPPRTGSAGGQRAIRVDSQGGDARR